MNCAEAKQQMSERMAGAPVPALERHLNECGDCREEWAEVSRTWNRLSEWPDEAPSPMVRARFYQMLEAYEEGVRAAASRPVKPVRSWWALSPAMQFAVAACLLTIGVLAGSLRPWSRSGGDEVAKLQSEVQNMRQLVALSLLQQQSASDRLRGVNYAYRVQNSDTEVLSALLRTLNSDPSVNVRLSTIDALRPFGASPVARRGIAQALAKQESPLVQASLLELIRELGDEESLELIEQLAANPEVNESVRERARAVAADLSR